MRPFMWTLMLIGLAVTAVPGAAQERVDPDDSAVTVAVLAGSLGGAETLAHDTEFESGPAFGASLTYWAQSWLGVRGRALRADPTIRTEDFALSRLDPDVWLVGAELLVRRPFLHRMRMVSPYLAAGAAAKRYGFDDPYHAPALTLGGGVEVRMGGLGAFAEASHVVSEFNRIGFQEGTRDWLLSAGLSFSLGGGDGSVAVLDSAYHPVRAGL